MTVDTQDTSDQPAAPPAGGTAMHKKALRGSAWTLGGIAASRVIRLANNLILTRLMDPGPIGIMNLANVLMQGLQMFSDIGIRPAIIQNKRGDDPDFLNTAWTMSVIRGFVLWALSCALAWPYAKFYNEPILMTLIPVLGYTAVLAGMNSTSLATANRHLALGRLTMLELFAQVMNTVVVLIWAYFDPSPWALVAGGMCNAICYLVLSFVWLPGVKHRFRWDRDSARDLIRFGRWVFLSTAITFLAVQCDPIVLGKIASVALLAVYGIGKMWGTLPAEVFQQLLTRVFFPIISDMARRGKLERARICELRTRLLLPVAIGTGSLFVVSDVAIRFMYRSEYWGAGPVFAITAIAAWFGIISYTYGVVLLSTGTLKSMTLSTAVKTIVFFALVFPAYQKWHLSGVALCVVAGEIIALGPILYGAYKLNVAMPLRELILSAAGAAFGLAMYGVQTGVINATGSNLAGILANAAITGAVCLGCVRSLFAYLKRSSGS